MTYQTVTHRRDPAPSLTPRACRVPRLGRNLIAAAVLSALCFVAAPAAAQYARVPSLEVGRAQAKVLQRSRWARQFVTVNGTTVTAQHGLILLQHRRTGVVHILPPAMSQPPRTMFQQIIVPGSGPNDTMVAYVCACAEQNADPNADDCGFEVDNNYNSMCRWEGDGESRCSCEPRVVVWGDGEEQILTYAGDPVG